MARTNMNLPDDIDREMRHEAVDLGLRYPGEFVEFLWEKYKNIRRKKTMKMTAEQFADINGTDIKELQNFGDACIGAEALEPNTVLYISIEGDNIRVTRCDNDWNEPVDVIYGKKENWNI